LDFLQVTQTPPISESEFQRELSHPRYRLPGKLLLRFQPEPRQKLPTP
jgi:hypothetical protein